jgi:hypothetical protein
VRKTVKRYRTILNIGSGCSVVITIQYAGKMQIKRRTVSPGMARVADQLVAEFGIPADRAGDPDFYLVDRLTGWPIIPRKKKRKV